MNHTTSRAYDRRSLFKGLAAVGAGAAVVSAASGAMSAAHAAGAPGLGVSRAVSGAPWGEEMGLAVPMYNFTWGYESKLPATINLIRGTGVHFVRTDAILDGLSWPGQTGIWWPYLDPQVDAIAREGGKIIMCVQTLPSYSRPDGTPRTTGPTTAAQRAEYVRLLKMLVTRYKSKVAYWEVWNEPNLTQFWGKPSIQAYGDLLRESYAAIKSVDKNAIVLSGGTGGAAPGTADIDAVAFLKGLYDRRMMLSHCDQVAIHAYARDDQIPASSTESVSLGEFARLSEYRKLMDSYGDTKKKLAITEAGAHVVSGTKATETTQASLYSQAAQAWSKVHDRGPIMWFSLYDEQNDACGLMRPGGTVKRPAYNTLAQITQRRG